ncbi:MAG: O-antigen ligase family protein [Planctomycetota bacterium]|jgi:O-antigen ligase
MIAAKGIASKEKLPLPAWLENTLLCIVLGLIVLRAMIIESPHIDQPQTRLFLSSEIVSLLTSTVLLACVGLWLFVSILCNRFRWRKTGFGIAVGVFVFAGVLSAVFASDKRAAVTDLVTLATPMFVGLLLVQLLTSQIKIRLALLLIVAVGVAATIQCVDQGMDSNEVLIAEYEANPVDFLGKQGVEPDSMEHWMYEHRLYSKDIRGFQMTSNSAASFFLLAIFAGLGMCLQPLGKKMSQESMAALACYLLGLLIVVFGLFLTQSKGGIGAFVLGVMLLVLLLAFGKTIWKRRRVVGILLLLAIVVGTGLVIGHGLYHGRLFGGNSMLVRWQYWVSAAEMIRDHIATGVGGGNFPEFYTHYKIPAASETVQNPHNWVLSLLSQYGPLGLAAFMAAFLLPLYRACRHFYANGALPARESTPRRSHLWIGLLASASVVLLLIRPVLVDAEFLYQRVDVRSAAYLVLYLFPAGVVILSFILLRVASLGDVSANGRNDRLAIALMCGLVAVLIHNLIDFAIFEPGNWSVFWLFIAALTALTHNTTEVSEKTVTFDVPKRLGALAGLLILAFVYVAVALAPPIRAESLFKRAMFNDVRRIKLIETAIAADQLSSKTAYKSASMFCQAYQRQQDKDRRFLDKALELSHIAAARNPADFKPWRLRGQVKVLLAAQAEGDEKDKYLQAALDDVQQAIKRYPGSGQLHYNLANIAEELGRNDVALMHYQTAVEIEDAYRAQFRVMYPERKTVISRLGNTAYENAKSKRLESN